MSANRSLLATRVFAVAAFMLFALFFPMRVQAQSCDSGAIPCFQGLGFLNSSAPSNFSSASGISADGSIIVGSASYGGGAQQEAVRWVNGVISGLGQLSGCVTSCWSSANSVSADGSVIVGSGTDSSGNREGFRWTSSGITGLGFLSQSYTFSEARAVSSDGSTVVGDSSGVAVEWIGGNVTDLPRCSPGAAFCQSQANAVNGNGSVVVGVCCGFISGNSATEWVNGTNVVIPSAAHAKEPIGVSSSSTANAVSSDGSVVAGSTSIFDNSNIYSTTEAWVAANGTSNTLGFWPAACNVQFSNCSSSPAAVGSDGTIVVGSSTTRGGQNVAVVWTAASGMQSVQALLGSYGINMSGWVLQNASALSADGSTLVGNGIDPNGLSEAWMARLPRPIASIPYLVDTHDFDGFDTSDILWRNANGDVGLWLMNGAKITNSATINTSTPISWAIVGQRDFDGNGSSDILWRNSNGDVGMWLMWSTDVLRAPTIGNVPTNWSIVATGDFNGDGKGDILWEDNQGNLGIWFMNGATVLQTAIVGQVPDNWSVIGANTNSYIFLRNNKTGELGIWVMNGNKVAQTADLGAVPLNWSVAGIGDFDGNGSSDILWRDTSGNVGIWLLQGMQVMTGAAIGTVPLSWSIVQTGDYNGDGMSDILWADNNGDVGAWVMNGTTLSSVANYSNVGTSWSVQSLNAE